MLRPIALAMLIALSPGCIQRSIKINSQPEGALVYLNDVEVGRTPMIVPFTFYGVYDVRLEKAGYQTLNVAQKASAPWYDNPGPDLICELAPWRTNVQLEWFYDLEELQPVDEALTVERARQLRDELNADLSAPIPPSPDQDQTITPQAKVEPEPPAEPAVPEDSTEPAAATNRAK